MGHTAVYTLIDGTHSDDTLANGHIAMYTLAEETYN